MNTAKLVLNQTQWYNGHGQMEVSEMSIKEALKLCRKLGKLYTGDGEPTFVLEVWCERNKSYSGDIYQVNGIEAGTNKLWLSIENLIV